MSQDESATIEDRYREERTFPPPVDFAANALYNDPSIYDTADADFEAFWADAANELLDRAEPFHTTLEWGSPGVAR